MFGWVPATPVTPTPVAPPAPEFIGPECPMCGKPKLHKVRMSNGDDGWTCCACPWSGIDPERKRDIVILIPPIRPIREKGKK